MRIAAIETRRYRYPLDPPFLAAWDPVPRTHQDATIVVVRSDDGVEGYASGDGVPDRELLERLLTGWNTTPGDVYGTVGSVDFHHGRNWIVEVACWDLRARAEGLALSQLLGADRSRIGAYASAGELVDAEERVRRCGELREAGIRAVKLRLNGSDWRLDLPVIQAVRESLPDLDLMVDANQGWRMPGDLTPRWDLETALAFARELEPLDIYWLEEPLPSHDLFGYAALREGTSVRLAAGEMVRTMGEARDLVIHGKVDVIQPDVVLSGGIEGAREIASLANEHGKTWSPHTWSNGYGLLANVHAALAFSTCPYIEVPLDPPAWSPERRDWLLPVTLEVAPDGTIGPPEGPGLGVVPDFDALEQYRVG
jgi:L-alanine-DL-glutamate epimerase-like enolase superfamily enzyme